MLEKKPEESTTDQPVPWKRGPKKQNLVPEEHKEKQWPTGKRRPNFEEEQEEIKLKPIPTPKNEFETKPEKCIEGPEFVPQKISEV